MGLAQLESRLGDLMGTLTSQRVPGERHRTIDATVRWSYDLLTSEERLLFDRLAVFIGGFRVEAAQAVCGDARVASMDIPDVLVSLAEQSMIERVPTSVDRYRMLEPLRAIAIERLNERDEFPEIASPHIDYFHQFADQAAIERRSSALPRIRRLLTEDSANLRAAMAELANRQQWSQLATVVDSLAWFWMDESRIDEAERWTDILLPRLDVIDASQGAGLHLLRAFMATKGKHREDGRAEIEQAIEGARETGDRLLEADAITFRYEVADILAKRSKDHETAIVRLKYAIEIYEDAEDEFGLVSGLNTLGHQFLWGDRADEALEPLERAMAISTRTNNDSGLAWALISMSQLRIRQAAHVEIDGSEVPALLNRAIAISLRSEENDAQVVAVYLLGAWLRPHGALDEAAQRLTEAAGQADIRGNLFMAIGSYCMLADTERSRRNLPAATGSAILALDRGLTRSVESQLAWVVEVTAGIIADIGAPELSARLIGAAEELRSRLNEPMPLWDAESYQRSVARIEKLAGDTYAVNYAEGAGWSIAHAAGTARSALAVSAEYLAPHEPV
jgi:non-specific serine/threonine protein kinase